MGYDGWWFTIWVRPSGRVAQPANGVQHPQTPADPPRLNIYVCVACLCGAITVALHYRDAGICGRGKKRQLTHSKVKKGWAASIR